MKISSASKIRDNSGRLQHLGQHLAMSSVIEPARHMQADTEIKRSHKNNINAINRRNGFKVGHCLAGLYLNHGHKLTVDLDREHGKNWRRERPHRGKVLSKAIRNWLEETADIRGK